MSDANLPEQNPDPHQPAPTTPASWFAGWEEFSTAPEAHSHSGRDPVAQPPFPDGAAAPLPPMPTSDAWGEWQTVEFPNTVSAEALEQQAQGGDRHLTPVPDAAHPVARTIPPEASPDTWAENTAYPDAQPNISELISLIQELNQCNNALLDRVSQLEEALEQTQNATLVQNANVIQAIAPDTVDLHSLHSQVVALSSQLDLSQQISQRQQVLAETLTQQLSASQARVAQLEQECVLSQQLLNEQLQRLAQSECDCRDLRARLQRQQRHTLQFKAALERCLEVPADLSEALDAGIEAATSQPWNESQSTVAVQSLLPKVQQIQPWSARSGGSSLPLKLDALVSRSSAQTAQPASADLPTASGTEPTPAGLEATAPEPPVIADPLPPTELPGTPQILQAAESAVVPVPITVASHLSGDDSNDAVAATPVAAGREDPDTFTPPPIPSVNDMIKTLLAPEAVSDAEVSLWQDLARLVNGVTADGPTDISQLGDVESSHATPEAAQPVAQTAPLDRAQEVPPKVVQMVSQPVVVPEPGPTSGSMPEDKTPQPLAAWKSAIAPGPLPIPPLVPTAAAAKPKLLAAPFDSSVWASHSPVAATPPARAEAPAAEPVNPEPAGPSPVVYPERPIKKIQSLAAVDLPSFPR